MPHRHSDSDIGMRPVDSRGSGDVIQQRYIVVNSKIVAARCLMVVRIWAKLIGARLNRGLSGSRSPV